ncbi:MAG TPA: UDP-N-acetylglucosamine-1-phosphate transferase [Nitrosopumilaceae archaeon]|nr:UDP-N-acetylglucosamine-1-phosphate transferase [Nitrosopumilaceae archaeon]
MEQEIIAAIVTSVIAFFVVYLTTPFLIKDLEKRNHTVKDVFKKGNVMVVRPGGPSIIAGILASEFGLYAFSPSNEIVAIIIITSLCFLIGFIDDKKVLRGWFKPITLAFAAIPIILLGAYDSDLTFPIFGEVKIPVLYFAIIIIMIVITGNTVNSIDVMNGVASGFMTIAGFALTISLFIVQNYEIAIASLPLGFVSLAFYKYHKFPSKIFPGDSGALALGGMYGTIAIVGEVEIIAAVALLPAIINSFLFLASMKKIVEHREIKAKPVIITDDFKIKSSSDKKAPISLVRLIVSAQPLSEKQVGSVIFRLGIFSGVLAVITAFLMVIKI